MSDYPVLNVLTTAGAALIAASGLQTPIVFTKAVLGTGEVLVAIEDAGTLKSRTALETYFGDAVITGRHHQGTALVVTAELWNTEFQSALTLREIGLMAKLADQDSTEILFSYLTFGSHPDLIPAGSATPVMRLYDVPFDFSGGDGTEITPSGMVRAEDVSVQAEQDTIVRRNEDGEIEGNITGGARYLLGDSQYSISDLALAGHVHAAATSSAAGFMSANDKAAHDQMAAWVTQDLTENGVPKFAGLVVNGFIDGAQFR